MYRKDVLVFGTRYECRKLSRFEIINNTFNLFFSWSRTPGATTGERTGSSRSNEERTSARSNHTYWRYGPRQYKKKEKNEENTKVLEYPIVIITVGAFIESPSSVRRRAQWCDCLGDDERYIDVWKYVIQCLRTCLITRKIGKKEEETGEGQSCS